MIVLTIARTAITAYNTIAGALSNTENPVICAHLIGETLDNINDLTTPKVTFNAASVQASAGYGKYYSGTVIYTSDPTQAGETLPVKVANATDAIPPVFAGVWPVCVGELKNNFYCPGRASLIKHRRLIVQYQVNSTNGLTESRELPAIIRTGAKSCADTLASNTAIFCISYKGESRKNIHTL